MDTIAVKRLIELNVIKNYIDENKGLYVPVAISARHVHLSRADMDILFGRGYSLKKLKDITQPGQFACEETVTFAGPKGRMEKMRVLGPERKETQVELSLTDCYKVGVKPFIRMSGDLEGTPGGKLIGPAGEVELDKGVIVAARHLHLSSEEAGWFGLKNGDIVSVKKGGERALIMGNVVVRTGEAHSLEMHIDTDEANAAGMLCGELLELVRS